MKRSEPFALAVPVNHTDHVIGHDDGAVQNVSFGLERLCEAVEAGLRR